MATTLPVPITFELPDGWLAAPPDEVGAEPAAFVALRPDRARAGFTPNITVTGEFRPDQASLVDIADDSIGTLAETTGSATLLRRNEAGSPDAPGLTQLVRVREDLAQYQVYLGMHDVEDHSRRVVLQFALTASADQVEELAGDFERFVSSVRPGRE